MLKNNMSYDFHSPSTLEYATTDLVYSMPKQWFSCYAPAKAIAWLEVNLNISNFKSFRNFDPTPPWHRGIANINVDGLEELGLNKDRCSALRNGFDLALQDYPSQKCKPDNYKSLYQFGELVEKKLRIDAEKGIIELFTPTGNEAFGCIFHPLGAVPKGEDDCRIIIDSTAAGINNLTQDSKVAFPNIQTLLNGIKPGYFGCTFDLTQGFFQLKLRPDLANFICITLPSGATARYRHIGMGLKAAPFLFQGTMMDIRELMIQKGIIDSFSMVYMDDVFIGDPCGTKLSELRFRFITFMDWAGFVLHPDKQPLPAQQFKALGYEIDTIALTLGISEKKVKERIAFLEESKSLLQTQGLERSWVDKLAGKLNHQAVVVRGGREWNTAWWDQLKKETKTVKESKRLVESLNWWISRLSSDIEKKIPLWIKSDGFLDLPCGVEKWPFIHQPTTSETEDRQIIAFRSNMFGFSYSIEKYQAQTALGWKKWNISALGLDRTAQDLKAIIEIIEHIVPNLQRQNKASRLAILFKTQSTEIQDALNSGIRERKPDLQMHRDLHVRLSELVTRIRHPMAAVSVPLITLGNLESNLVAVEAAWPEIIFTQKAKNIIQRLIQRKQDIQDTKITSWCWLSGNQDPQKRKSLKKGTIIIGQRNYIDKATFQATSLWESNKNTWCVLPASFDRNSWLHETKAPFKAWGALKKILTVTIKTEYLKGVEDPRWWNGTKNSLWGVWIPTRKMEKK